MKKLFAMLLSVAVILSTITIPAYAETGSPTTDDVVFSIENVTAAPGTDVSVAFNIEGEYESHALTAFVRYDTNMLSVVGNGIAQGNIWQNMIAGGGTIVADAVTRPGQVPFMAIMPTNPFSGSGTIFTMNFHVNESVELGTVIPLELEIREFYYMPVQQTSPTLIPFTSDNGSITAQVYHSVTFVDYDGTVLSAQSVAHGSAAIEPTAPEREGYAFIGWDKDFSNVTEDMTVTAQYSANSYSITYTVNGEEYTAQTYEFGAVVSAPEYTVPEGHTFSGWNIPETMPAENLVLDAALTVNSYSITYTINGEEYTAQTYEFGAVVSAPEYTVPEGHTFSGWNIPETMPAENLVLDAALTVNEYTVTYNINGEIYAIQVYAYGEEVFAPAYDVPDHFTFSGWDTPATMPAENIVLDATLVEDGKYTVSFMVDGETYFTFTGYEGDVITVPENPEKLGYTFDAWDGMPEDGVLPAANITVTAVWSVNTYTITYTVNGDEYTAQTYEFGAAVSAPEYTVPEGHTFSGWNIPETMPAENLVLDAALTVNSYSITYTVNGEEYTAQTYEFGAAVSAPEYTVPEGHTFSGWNIPETMPAENLVLDAALTVNSYSITYTINGEEYTAQTYEFGAVVSAPEYTVPEGHTFSGWNIPETMPAENLVLDAALTVNEYTVTYNINGEIYAIQVYAYGEEVFAPAYDVPDHFTFSGWDTPATMPAENIVLDATLVEDGKYTVSFMVDGETYFTFTGYEGDVITVPENPEKLGYTFDAWDGMPEDGVLPAANITVTAVWSVNTYTITYTVNGKGYSVQTYEYGAAIITPAYDVPEGYTFSGWDIPETMPAEDLVVDATCTINVYEVTLIDGWNGDPIVVLYVAHGRDAVLPDAPEHAGYIFDRWDGDPTNVTEDRTITACYWMIGDVNHDGEITTYDALLIMRYALGLEAEGNELIMDFNGDGCVDSLDALLVLRRSISAA